MFTYTIWGLSDKTEQRPLKGFCILRSGLIPTEKNSTPFNASVLNATCLLVCVRLLFLNYILRNYVIMDPVPWVADKLQGNTSFDSGRGGVVMVVGVAGGTVDK